MFFICLKNLLGKYQKNVSMSRRGIFISVEGSDGSGKSTQLENIRKYFDEHDIPVIFTREPGGTAIGEKIREIILDNENSEMCDLTEMFLYAASRAQHVTEKIIPALEEGLNVVTDRFVDSSIAYQGYGRGLLDCVKTVNDFAVCGRLPDYTFFLDLDPVIGKSRITAGSEDRLEQEKNEFHLNVYNGYKDLIKDDDRFIVIDASGTIEEVKSLIYDKLDCIFGDML